MREIPVIRGGEDLDEVLDIISADLKALLEAESKGEDVADKKAALVEEQKRVEAQKEAEEKAEAETKAAEAKAAEAKAADGDAGDEKLAKMIALAVKSALSEHDGTSRYVGPGADPEVVKDIAEGKSYRIVEPRGGEIKVGDNRAVKGFIERKSFAELMQAMVSTKEGMGTDDQRDFLRYLSAKALAEGTPSAGGVLVPEEWMPDLLTLLRAKAVVRRAGPRFVPFNKQMNQTSMSSGGTAYYFAENTEMTTSEPTFAEVAILTPKNMGVLVPVSNFLLADAAQAESIVREDMAEVMALREDLAFLRGTGTLQPLGFLNMVSITEDPIYDSTSGNGIEPTLPELRRMKAVFRSQNAGAIRPAWFAHPDFLTYLETLTDADGKFLADSSLLKINDDQISGTLDGVPIYTTTQNPMNLTIGTSADCMDLFIVNMAEAIVGINMELQLDVSTEATYNVGGTWHGAFQDNQTLFRAIMRHDITHRRPAQVVVQHGVRPAAV